MTLAHPQGHHSRLTTRVPKEFAPSNPARHRILKILFDRGGDREVPLTLAAFLPTVFAADVNRAWLRFAAVMHEIHRYAE